MKVSPLLISTLLALDFWVGYLSGYYGSKCWSFARLPSFHFSRGQSSKQSVPLRLRQAVEGPLLRPSSFARLGLAQPRGLLLVGPPGCGKTSIALAVAAGCAASTVFSVGAADVYSPFVGDSEKVVASVSGGSKYPRLFTKVCEEATVIAVIAQKGPHFYAYPLFIYLIFRSISRTFE